MRRKYFITGTLAFLAVCGCKEDVMVPITPYPGNNSVGTYAQPAPTPYSPYGQYQDNDAELLPALLLRGMTERES
ncbi:MAG: hypothetical protein H6908_06575 [Hyphomicrobiales bacterium]|nr:hypothetical protein [Hyphomicrobiales bacterium]